MKVCPFWKREQRTMQNTRKDIMDIEYNKKQQNPIGYPQENPGNDKKSDDLKDQSRLPHQQNRLKDQENSRR